jgi:hypothetical protein
MFASSPAAIISRTEGTTRSATVCPLLGLVGNDVICGGPGNDTLKGGGGKDKQVQ